MGLCRKIFVVFFLGGIASAALLGFLYGDHPDSKEDGYWGYEATKDDPLVRKFKVHVDDSTLGDLKRRLESARFTQLPQSLRSQAGLSMRALTEVVRYWKDHYDWSTQEAQLNRYAHFRVAIEGIQVHFLRARPRDVDPKTKVFTLLMIHGWPGSVAEFLNALPLLNEAGNGFAFEVICPSIPGYGFSEVPHKEGFDILDAARLFGKLMERLGRKEFYIHGSGSGGTKVAKQMALHYPDRVLGAHFTTVEQQPGVLDTLKLAAKVFVATFVFNKRPPPAPTFHPLEGRKAQLLRETEYSLQETRPDIAGIALLDSPTALAAYILDAMFPHTIADMVWSGREEPKMKPLHDAFLTNVMLYWVSDSVTSNLKFYKENAGKIQFTKPTKARVSVPVGFSLLPEVWIPTNVLSTEYENVVTVADCPKGERFAAMYQPTLLAKHIREFVAAVEKKNKTRSYKGAPMDFPFIVIEPQAPRVTEPLNVTTESLTTPAKRQRVRPVSNTHKQRFEPKPVATQQAPHEDNVQPRRGSATQDAPSQKVRESAGSGAKPAETAGRTAQPAKPTDSGDRRGDTAGTLARSSDKQSDHAVRKAQPTAKPAQPAAKREEPVVHPTAQPTKKADKLTSETEKPQQATSAPGRDAKRSESVQDAAKSASAEQHTKAPETASNKAHSTVKPAEGAMKPSGKLAEENTQQSARAKSTPRVEKAEHKTATTEAPKVVKASTKPNPSQTSHSSSQGSVNKPQENTPAQKASRSQTTK